jgi:hypothetical protein
VSYVCGRDFLCAPEESYCSGALPLCKSRPRCDPHSYFCVYDLAPDCDPSDCTGVEDGVPCDDGDWCTVEEECWDGVCGGTGHANPRYCDTKYGSGNCLNNACEVFPKDQTCRVRGCIMGKWSGDQDGNCVPDGTNDCPADMNDECLSGPPTCSEVGECIYQQATTGTSCDDGDPCTQNDVCNLGGLCRGTAAALNSPCTPNEEGLCDASSKCLDVSGVLTCVTSYKTSGSPCDSGSNCRTSGTCDSQGVCNEDLANVGASCTLSEGCSDGVCDVSGDCVPSDFLCSGDCLSGVCSGNDCLLRPQGYACDDLLDCTDVDVCNVKTQYMGNTVSCGGALRPGWIVVDKACAGL